MKLIGLDIGTTSICGVLVHAETGKIVKTISKPNTSALRSPFDWEYTQDVSNIMHTVLEIVDELKEGVPDIRGIGVTGQMHGILYADDKGDALSPLFTWQDQRGNLCVSGAVTYAEQLRILTGYPAATGYGMVTHYYHVRNDSVPMGAAVICTISDYVAARLACRSKPVMDATNAASLGLYRLDSLEFDREALKEAGIDPGILPAQVESGKMIGHTADGIPVFAAIGDNQASFIGSVPDIRRSLLVNIGTGSQISAYMDEYAPFEQVDIRPFPGGGYLLVGASLSGGKSYALLAKFFREVIKQFGKQEAADPYEVMNELAERPLEEGTALRVNTRFFGTRSNPGERGAIENIGPANFTPGHLVHGILEGMVEELAQYYDAFPAAVKKRLDTIAASGNGVQRNRALRAKLERRFDLPLVITEFPEEAAYGAAVSAGVGAGLYPNYGTPPSRDEHAQRRSI